MTTPALISSLLALTASALPVPAPPADTPAPSLASLFAEYRALGLPLPPATARLVRFEIEGGGVVNGKVLPPGFGLALELSPGTKTDGPILQSGLYPHQRPMNWEARPRPVAAVPESAAGVRQGADRALLLAVQCHARGWDELAQALLTVSRTAGDGTPPVARLVTVAWDYWEGLVTDPTADRGPVLQRLRELTRREPSLDTEPHRALLRSLELALAPGTAKPGSMEALIDRLVDFHGDTGGPFWPEPGGPAYRRLADLGFEAVPALIAHLGDDRLTRSRMVGFNNFRTWHRRVGDVAGDLIEALAAEPLAREADGEEADGGWLRRQQGYRLSRAAAARWWEQARTVGEEAHLLARVLPAADGGEPAHVNTHLLGVIAAKYPKHVPVLYRAVLDGRPAAGSWELAEALARCAVPADQKVGLLRSAAQHADWTHRLPALRLLRPLDRPAFEAELLATLDALPADVPDKYWSRPEGHLAGLATEADDPRVWASVERAARRATVGLRMELLAHFGDPKDGRRRAERLRLLAAFLDDPAVRDVAADERLHGPGAGFGYRRIAVRDFAAVELGRLLGIGVIRKEERTPAEWSGIRSQVRDALNAELTANTGTKP